MTAVAELIEGRELLVNLTLRELRGKYKRSVLGWTWSMLNPISTIVIFSVVFGTLLGNDPPVGNPSGLHNFTLWLSCGLLPWAFTSNGISATLPQLVGNSNLIKKVYFPREYIIASSVLSWVVSFLIELFVLCLAFLVTGRVVFQWIPVLLLLVLLQTLLVLGYSLALSVLQVYFRDVQHFWGIFLQIWFYLTPIVYPITLLQRKVGPCVAPLCDKPVAAHRILGIRVLDLYRLNPMVRVVEAYRRVLYDGRLPDWSSLGIVVLSCLVVLAIGWAIFRRLEPRLAEEL
jgi:ABC-type polysaccharide/polyol phosphate export permease